VRSRLGCLGDVRSSHACIEKTTLVCLVTCVAGEQGQKESRICSLYIYIYIYIYIPHTTSIYRGRERESERTREREREREREKREREREEGLGALLDCAHVM
jgi:hypothetical protein